MGTAAGFTGQKEASVAGPQGVRVGGEEGREWVERPDGQGLGCCGKQLELKVR